MAAILTNDWADLLADEFKQPYYLELREFLKREYASRTVYPDMHDLFNALHFTAYADVRAVILGQDPYHGAGQAHGLSFSVKPGIPAPPSLQNMLKELRDDLGCPLPDNGYLVPWAQQGVLLLNTVLTVREGEANSHKGKGWERFTDRVISLLNEREKPIVFILWGSHAQQKMQLITNRRISSCEACIPVRYLRIGDFFRQQAVFASECFPAKHRQRSDRLAAARSRRSPRQQRINYPPCQRERIAPYLRCDPLSFSNRRPAYTYSRRSTAETLPHRYPSRRGSALRSAACRTGYAPAPKWR